LSIRQVREFWLSLLIAPQLDARSMDEAAAGDSHFPYARAANHDDEETQNMPSFYKLATHSEVSRPSTGFRVSSPDEARPSVSMPKRHPGELSRDLYPPTSPNTDVFGNDVGSPRNEVRRRMSSSAAQSVQMKVFKCCHCLTPLWMSSLAINESMYNSYLMSELIVESLPLLMLNVVNMLFLSDRITTMSIVQAVCAAVFVVYSWAKTAYYVRFHEWNLAKFLE